jgi:hypothetical protein
MIEAVLERGLAAEQTAHLGYEKVIRPAGEHRIPTLVRSGWQVVHLLRLNSPLIDGHVRQSSTGPRHVRSIIATSLVVARIP